jgi:hypothetical protein
MYTRKTVELGFFTVVSILFHLSLALIFSWLPNHPGSEEFAFSLTNKFAPPGKQKKFSITYFNFHGDGTVVESPKKMPSMVEGSGQKSTKTLSLHELRDTGFLFSDTKSEIEVTKTNGDLPVQHNSGVGELSYKWQGQLKSKVSESEFAPMSFDKKPTGKEENSTSFSQDGGPTQANNASIGVVIPGGVQEGTLNKWQLVLYAFHKRIFSQFLMQLYLNAEEMERKYPYAQFPYSRVADSVKVKATYDARGTLQHIERQKSSDTGLLNEFFMNAMNDLSSFPNPPKLILNENNEFELIFEIQIIH